MPTIQEQYTELAKRGQEATAAVVDQVFDFATTVIDVQRTLAKHLVTTSATVAEEIAQRATAAVNEAGKTAANG